MLKHNSEPSSLTPPRFAQLGRLSWPLILVVLLGCGESTEIRVPADAQPSYAEKALNVPKPEVALEQQYRNLAKCEFGEVWKLLPASFRSDISELVKEHAAKQDAALWDRRFLLIAKFARVLKEKQLMVVKGPLKKLLPRTVVAALDKKWDSLVELVEIYATSEIKTLAAYQKLDLEPFLATTGKELGKRLIVVAKCFSPEVGTAVRELENSRFAVINRSADTASMRREVSLTRVIFGDYVYLDGGWVTKDWAEVWPVEMGQRKRDLKEYVLTPELRAEQTAQLDAIERSLDHVLVAEDQAAFDAGLAPLLEPLAGYLSRISELAQPR